MAQMPGRVGLNSHGRPPSSARSAEVCRAGLVPAKTDRSTARAQKARILCFAISLGPPSHRAAVMAPMEAPATRRTGSPASSSTSIAPRWKAPSALPPARHTQCSVKLSSAMMVSAICGDVGEFNGFAR